MVFYRVPESIIALWLNNYTYFAIRVNLLPPLPRYSVNEGQNEEQTLVNIMLLLL